MADLFSNLNSQYAAAKGMGAVPTTNPLVAGMYNSDFQGGARRTAFNALANEASIQAKYDRDQREAALLEKKKKIESRDYERVPTDLGFEFYDPTGKKISAWDYARAKGVGLSDALQETTNPADIAAMEDYEIIKQLTYLASIPKESRTPEDQKNLDEYLNDNPELKGATPSAIMRAFMQNHRNVFYGG